MLAVDFFHVDCAVTLKLIYIFFAPEVDSRYVHILGTTSQSFDAVLADAGSTPPRPRRDVRERTALPNASSSPSEPNSPTAS
ncbi:MAG: putative transposase [Pseudonocardiales bacterium]|nr:putative transposase [Pseudonocardiales bacterium]